MRLSELFFILCWPGVVLFPEATLPLRIIQPNLIVSVERAMGQIDSPYTIGVVRKLLALFIIVLNFNFTMLDFFMLSGSCLLGF